MTTPLTFEVSDLVLDETYDPLAGEEPALDDEAIAAAKQHPNYVEEFEPYLGDPAADHAPKIVEDTRPAAIRTAELFEQMKTRRTVLLGILDLCREPVSAARVFAYVEEAQAANISVYGGEALCKLLTRAGALEKLEPSDQEPAVVEVDGAACYAPAPRMEVCYVATPEGLAVLEADKPADRLIAALEREPQYKPIYLRILVACDEEGGKSAADLGVLVDHDPLVQSPRRWAAYFFNILRDCGALVWNRTWQTTEVGRAGADRLAREGVQG